MLAFFRLIFEIMIKGFSIFITLVILICSCKRGSTRYDTEIGIVQYKANRLDKAVITFTNVIDRNDTCFECYLYRGLAYKGLEKYDEAVGDFTYLISKKYQIAT